MAELRMQSALTALPAARFVCRLAQNGCIGRRAYDQAMLTVREAAQRLWRNAAAVRRWIREEQLRAVIVDGQHLIDPVALTELRDGLYPMLSLPPEWRMLEDGTAAPNWVAGVALSRTGR